MAGCGCDPDDPKAGRGDAAGGPEKRLLIRSASILVCLGARMLKNSSPIAVISYFEKQEMPT